MEGAAADRIQPADRDGRRRHENRVVGTDAGGTAPMNPVTVNPPVATPFFFYGTAAVMIIGGILVITRKNAVHSALALITTLLAQAALYLMLYAPFVAGVQIILYAGGIMVLFLFFIMLVSIEKSTREYQFNHQWHVAGAATVALGGLLVYVYVRGSGIFPTRQAVLPETLNTQQVSLHLFSDYLLPFEIASLLLLVAIVGGVVMAKKRI